MSTTMMTNPAIVGRIDLSGIALSTRRPRAILWIRLGATTNIDPFSVLSMPVPIIDFSKLPAPIDHHADCADDGVMRVILRFCRLRFRSRAKSRADDRLDRECV